MALQLTAFPTEYPDDPSKQIITTGERFERLIRWLQTRKAIVVDYETSGTAWFKHARIAGIGLASWDDQGRIWNAYVPVRHRTASSQLSMAVVGPAVKQLLENTDVLKVGHNIKFEDHFSRKEGWRILGPRYDTMVAARLYNDNERFLKLEKRAETDLGIADAMRWNRELNAEVAKLARANGMGIEDYKYRYGYSEVDPGLCGIYCCTDTSHTAQLHDCYERWGVSRYFPRIWKTEMRLTSVLCDMEQAGMPIDVPYLQAVKVQVQQAKAELERRIQEAMGGYQFNIASDDELRTTLWHVLGLRWDKLTKGEQYAVDREVLESFAPSNMVCKLILDWRDADKIDTTYTSSILSLLDSKNYVHGNLKQMGTNTGRLSCEEPNYQNFPSDDEDRALAATSKKLKEGGKDPWSIRRAFTVRQPGWARLYFDYSQIELRVMAYYSRDPIMVDAYLRGEDIHDRTAAEVGAILQRECPRRVAKVVNFGLCIAENQKVLTDVGLVPIQEVRGWHKVWDGVEWVAHDGLICRGVCEVITHEGLTATPEHQVYTVSGQRLPIGELASALHPAALAIGAIGEVPVGYSAFDRTGCDAWPESCNRGHLWGLWTDALGVGLQRQGRQDHQLYLPGQVPGFAGAYFGGTLRCDDAALLSGYACFLYAVQRAWDQSSLSIAGAFRSLGFGDVPARGFSGQSIRPDRQQRALRAEQSEIDHLFGQHSQYRLETRRVYDLLNAGPRHRFTVSGKIVSNSYCMSERGLSAQAKIPEEEAAVFLAAFFQRYKGISAFRNELWAKARRQGCQWQNIFGRIRRLPDLKAPEFWKARRAERQMIGSAIQGTAAELTKESLCRLADWFEAEKIPAIICNTIHDEIQIDCPKECLPQVVKGAKRYMEDFPEFAPIPILVDAAVTYQTWADKGSYKEESANGGQST